MTRRSRRNGSRSWLMKLVLAVVVVWGSYYLYENNIKFNPQKILDNSILKQHNFETKVEEITSPKKNIKAYLFQDDTNPIISMSFIFKNAGQASDDVDKKGIANLAAELLGYGAGNLDAHSYREELENNAISLDFNVNADDFTGNLLTTKSKQDKAYELLKLVLTEPRFAKEGINQVKAQFVMALKQQQESPESVLSQAFNEVLYKDHPYARNPLGDKNNIEKIQKEQLQEFMRNHLTLSNLIVGVAGDITPEEVGVMLDEVFGGLPEAGSINFVREAEVDFKARQKNINFDSAQNIASFAALGVERSHPDFYPLYVANYILGGSGLNSRLSILAREKEGLTYGIYTYLGLADKSSTIQGGFSSTPENFSKVMNIVKSEWKNLGDNGVSAKELEDAKNYLISSYNLRFAAIGDIADILAYMQKDNLGLDFLQKRNDYVRSVTLDEVNQAAKKYFDVNKLVFVNIGNFEKE